MPQFDVTTFIPQLFWLGVLFTVFYSVARSVLIPRMQNILTSRQEKIASILEEAKTLALESDALKKTLQEKRAALQEKEDAELEKARKSLSEEYQKKHNEFTHELVEFLTHQENDIASHEAKLLGALVVSQKELTAHAHDKLAKKWGAA